ncbi:pullulanase, partial [Mycobacterium sp. ITM-2017-0098]
MEYCLGEPDGSATLWTVGADTDFDGDGVLDAVGLDVDHDGLVDDVMVDLDDDGSADHAVLDLDGDGRPEAYFTDDGTG